MWLLTYIILTASNATHSFSSGTYQSQEMCLEAANKFTFTIADPRWNPKNSTTKVAFMCTQTNTEKGE